MWKVQLIDEHLGESSATAPIWESRGVYSASFGNFELRLFISFVVFSHRAAGSARHTLVNGK